MTLQTQAAAKGNGAAATMPPPPPAGAPAAQAGERRRGRHPCRGAGAGRGAGRLHRRVPGRRSRQAGGAGRALADAGRRLPQCRLHPVEGAAARRQGDRRGRRTWAATASASPSRTIDIDELRGWKDGVVKKLTGGLTGLAKQRKVDGRRGHRPVHLAQPGRGGAGRTAKKTVSFEQAIIAAGSEPVTLPFIPHDDPRVIDSTGALELGGVPKRLLVIGGGIIGLEMATVYHALGSKVTIVELMDQIIPGADKDIVTPLMKRIQKQYENDPPEDQGDQGRGRPRTGLVAHFEGGKAPADRHLRPHPGRGRPAAERATIGAENAGRERWTSAASSRWTSRCAPTCRTSSRSATWSASRCWRTRRSHEGQVAAEAAAGQEQLLRRQGDPVGRLHRSGSRLGRA